jgi:Tfp pilus assembly protein PilF
MTGFPMRAALAAVFVASSLWGQDAVPRRPKLADDADTNDARAYWEWGNRRDVNWERTADARYWAMRLEPGNVDYFYGWWRALFNRQPVNWQVGYLQGEGYAVKTKEARLIDSLRPEVLYRDPFPYLRSPCYYPDLVDSRDPVVASLQFIELGCHQQAADRLTAALERKPHLWGLRLERARSLFLTQRYREAAAELQVVLDTLRARDEKYLGQVYNTKELLEHMLAATLLRTRDVAGARAALERALSENLAYYPAHAMLSQIAMDRRDIAGALHEAELAAGLRESSGVLRYDYGILLYRSGKLADAETQLGRAVELEPYWAEPRRWLAIVLEAQNKKTEALAAWEAYLARAPRRENVRIKEAQDRVAALKTEGS